MTLLIFLSDNNEKNLKNVLIIITFSTDFIRILSYGLILHQIFILNMGKND